MWNHGTTPRRCQHLTCDCIPLCGPMASIGPYGLLATFATNGKVSPRRDEGTPPYRCFIGLQHIIKCSVRNGLDRSLQIVFQLVPISIKPTSKRRTTRWFCVMRLYLSFVFYYTTKVSLVPSFQRRNQNSRKTTHAPGSRATASRRMVRGSSPRRTCRLM